MVFLILMLLLSPSVWGQGVDPTKPMSFTESVSSFVETGDFIVTGIWISAQDASAIINQKRVHVGDVIDGAEVLSITKEGITLKDKDGVKVIRIIEHSFRQTTKGTQKRQ